MKKPTIRVSKWLGDIPVEAHCTLCPDVVFKAKGEGHRPDREQYKKSLEGQFHAHLENAHPSGRVDPAAPEV